MQGFLFRGRIYDLSYKAGNLKKNLKKLKKTCRTFILYVEYILLE